MRSAIYLTFLIAIFVSVSTRSAAQTRRIDSLTRALSTQRTPTEQADIHFNLAESLYSHDFEKGFLNAEKSLDIAVKANYVRGQAQALTSLGTYYYYKGENKESQEALFRALKILKGNSDEDYPVRTYLRLAILYRQQAKYDSARLFLGLADSILKNKDEGALHGSLYASSGLLANALARNDEALVLLKKSLAIRRNLDDTIRLADTWRNIGAVYTDLSMYDSAESCYREASKLLAKVNDPEIHMLLNLSQGETNFERGNLTAAITHYNAALDKLKANTYKRHYAYLLYKIGELYENQGAYHTAYDYLFKALQEFESFNARHHMARAYSQIGWCYNYQENYTLAIENATKSLTIASAIGDSSSIAQNKNLMGYAFLKTNRFKDALTNFNEALVIRKKIKHWWGVSYTLYNTALLYIKIGQDDKALDFLSQSLTLNEKIGNKSGFVYANNELGSLYTRKRSFDKAAFHLQQANNVAAQVPLPTQLVANYKNYVSLYESMGNYPKSIQYFKLYDNLRDSLNNQLNSGRIAKADALFQLQKKANEILLINKENELHQEKIRTQQLEITFQQRVIVIVVCSLVVLLILIFVIYRLLKSRTQAKEILRKQNLAIKEQQEEILAQSEELTESNEKLAELNDELLAKNDQIGAQSEKILETNHNLELRVEQRTSQLNSAYSELETFFYKTSHDFRRPLTTYLGLVQLAKSTVQDKNALDLFEKVRETTEGLDGMLQKLQSISNVDYLSHLVDTSYPDLINGILKKFATDLNKRGINVIVDNTVGNIKTNDHLCRTFLENIVQNAINFSTPIDPYLRITASRSGGNVITIVEDNGQGIPATVQHRIFEMYFRGNDTSKGNGLGLYVAKRAIDKLGGTISFISRLNEGTSFQITFPVS